MDVVETCSCPLKPFLFFLALIKLWLTSDCPAGDYILAFPAARHVLLCYMRKKEILYSLNDWPLFRSRSAKIKMVFYQNKFRINDLALRWVKLPYVLIQFCGICSIWRIVNSDFTRIFKVLWTWIINATIYYSINSRYPWEQVIIFLLSFRNCLSVLLSITFLWATMSITKYVKGVVVLTNVWNCLYWTIETLIFSTWVPVQAVLFCSVLFLESL